MTTGNTMALTRWTFIGRVMSLLFNMLSRFIIAFLPRNNFLLISWLQSPSTVILEPPKSLSLFPLFPHLFLWSDEIRCHDLSFLNVKFQANFSTLLFHFHQEAFLFFFAFCHKGDVICQFQRQKEKKKKKSKERCSCQHPWRNVCCGVLKCSRLRALISVLRAIFPMWKLPPGSGIKV